MDEGVRIDVTDSFFEDGNTPLQIAVYFNHAAIIDLLLSDGAELSSSLIKETKTHNGKLSHLTQLSYNFYSAVKNGDIDEAMPFVFQTLQWLAISQNSHRQNAFHVACANNHHFLAYKMAENFCTRQKTKDCYLLNRRDGSSFTPLDYLAYHDNREGFLLLSRFSSNFERSPKDASEQSFTACLEKQKKIIETNGVDYLSLFIRFCPLAVLCLSSEVIRGKITDGHEIIALITANQNAFNPLMEDALLRGLIKGNFELTAKLILLLPTSFLQSHEERLQKLIVETQFRGLQKVATKLSSKYKDLKTIEHTATFLERCMNMDDATAPVYLVRARVLHIGLFKQEQNVIKSITNYERVLSKNPSPKEAIIALSELVYLYNSDPENSIHQPITKRDKVLQQLLELTEVYSADQPNDEETIKIRHEALVMCNRLNITFNNIGGLK